jgi:hypothetical protein
MYESFEEKEHQKEEETSGKSWSAAQSLSLLAMRSHVRNEPRGKKLAHMQDGNHAIK